MAEAESIPAPSPEPRDATRKTPDIRLYRKIELGIRQNGYGYEGYARCRDKQVTKWFPLGTPLPLIRLWRAQMAADHAMFKELARRLPRSPQGWCYLYVIQDSAGPVKIGRATDPFTRLSELQTAHHRPLRLVCAAPAHASLEAAVHGRFAHLRMEGEWFRVDAELEQFISAVADGKNPVALLW
jgi:hypothetical protein